MAPSGDDTDASMLRIKGNEFYKKNNFLLAIKFYQRAIEIADSNDPLPYSNLSAALFEIADYSGCVVAARTALLRVADQDSSLRERLTSRIINAELHIYAHDALPPNSTAFPNSQLAASHLRLKHAYCDQTKEQAWTKIIQEISSIKPILTGVAEHAVWGNDHAVSLYDSSLAAVSTLKPEHVAMAKANTLTTQSTSNQISLCFARIGDARNLYATWMMMSLDKTLIRKEKHIDILVNDVRPQTIARNLIMFILLEDVLAAATAADRSFPLHTMYYTYCNQLIPPYVEMFLKQKFVHLIEMLEGHALFPTWLKVPLRYRQSIVLVLRSWQRQNHIYTSKTIQKEVTASYFDDVKHGRLPTLENLGSRFVNEKLQIELSIYRKTMALYPDTEFAEKYEPELATAMAQFVTLEMAQGREVVKLRDHIAQNWKVNPTWYADDWEQYSSHIASIKPTIENIPNDFFLLLLPFEQPKEATCFYDYMKTFFSCSAIALRRLKKSMTITVSVGDVIQKFESARYLNAATEWTTSFGFDRISLGNAPDCAGLSMMSHLYAIPLLKKHDAALTALCSCLCLGLRNAQNTDITSTALATEISLCKALGVQYKGYLPDYLGSIFIGVEKGLLWYNTWRSLQTRDQAIDQLLSKDALSIWLYGLFFKLALPSNRPPKRVHPSEPPMLIHSPLNLSTFFRLLVHVAELGYPGNDLNQILVSILQDRVNTNARPVNYQVLTGTEVTSWNNNVKQPLCIAPFFAEISTLAASFTGVLPFAVIADASIVPPLDNVRKCTIRLPHLPYEENCNYLALIFTSLGFKQPAGGWGTDSLRGILLNQDYMAKHKDDVIVVTAWKYNAWARSGTFWMRGDIAKELDPKYWMCEVYNTYTWKPLYEDRAWSMHLDMEIGEAWI